MERRAIVLERPGPPESLWVSRVPVPEPRPRWVRIKVETFGLNRSEYHLRAGLATNASFPVIPGIEATGIVDAAPGGEYEPGQQVVAVMGGMGREYDGGYAEYTVVPATSVIPVTTDLDWATLGALPETLQTAHGSLYTGLDIPAGQTFLVRGGISSVGIAARRPRQGGRADRPLDHPEPGPAGRLTRGRRGSPDRGRRCGCGQGSGDRAGRCRCRAGARRDQRATGHTARRRDPRHGLLHRNAASCLRPHPAHPGDNWTVPDFYPIGYLPKGVRLTAYGGESNDLPVDAFQRYVDLVADGKLPVRIDRVFGMDEIAEAHRVMEEGRAVGKLVVRVS